MMRLAQPSFVQRKVIRREHVEALQINARMDLLAQFIHLAAEKLDPRSPPVLGRLPGRIVVCGPRKQFVRGVGYRIASQPIQWRDHRRTAYVT